MLQSRRAFLRATGAAVAASALAGCAGPLQTAETKGYRIGYLSGSTQAQTAPQVEAFRARLREFGYVEGRNVSIEVRLADGYTDRLPALAVELAALQPDVLVGQRTLEALALKKATSVIPIVLAGVPDPVENGLVASLARPAGNITGSGRTASGVIQRSLQLLKEALPRATRVAYLFDSSSPTQVRSSQEVRGAAPALGVEYVGIEVRAPEDFTEAFAAVRRSRPDALFVIAGGLAGSQQARILDFVAAERLPSIFAGTRDFVDGGGLIFYGEDLADGVRRAVPYVDRILKGSKPGDLPIEMTSTFALIINLRTAKALGLTIPPSVLAQATELIQ